MSGNLTEREQQILAAYERALNRDETDDDRALLAEAARNSEINPILEKLLEQQVLQERLQATRQRWARENEESRLHLRDHER